MRLFPISGIKCTSMSAAISQWPKILKILSGYHITISLMNRYGCRVTAQLNTWPIPSTYIDWKLGRYSFMCSMYWACKSGGSHPSPSRQQLISSNLIKCHRHVAIRLNLAIEALHPAIFMSSLYWLYT